MVKGKTVVFKINFTGGAGNRAGYLPNGRTYWSNPYHLGAMITLCDSAGARRIRIAEGVDTAGDTLEEYMYRASWFDVHALQNGGAAEWSSWTRTRATRARRRTRVSRCPTAGICTPLTT